MTHELIFRAQAEAEIAEAMNWYEVRRRGLGSDFLRAVDVALGRIRQNPYQHQAIKGQFRRVGLHRFPYGLIYVVSEREIVVVACFHGRRNPKDWQARTWL